MTISFNYFGNHGMIGNQMFQYAALKSLAIKYNRSFVIPPKEIFGTFYYQRLKSNIDQCFKIDCERGITNFPTIEERQFSFDEEFFNDFPSHDVNLLGFFQTEKYFKHIESQIKNDFSFIPEYYDVSAKLREDFTKELISIHIRRSDYVNNPSHASPNMSYYQESLDLLPQDCEVLIFSDDPQWCKSQKLFSSDRFLISETDDPYIDLCLMTMCQYHIIAASSFSWWGAYLSKSQKVIAPAVWFGPSNSHLNTDDIYLNNWIKM
jgi:hypothetical protein